MIPDATLSEWEQLAKDNWMGTVSEQVLALITELRRLREEVERLTQGCVIRGHGNQKACQDCLAEWRTHAEQVEQDLQESTDRENGWKMQSEHERAALAAHQAVARAAERLEAAVDRCLGGRGAFSCAEQHDSRCPKSRAESPDQWRGEWACECGSEELDTAIQDARVALAHPLVQRAVTEGG